MSTYVPRILITSPWMEPAPGGPSMVGASGTFPTKAMAYTKRINWRLQRFQTVGGSSLVDSLCMEAALPVVGSPCVQRTYRDKRSMTKWYDLIMVSLGLGGVTNSRAAIPQNIGDPLIVTLCLTNGQSANRTTTRPAYKTRANVIHNVVHKKWGLEKGPIGLIDCVHPARIIEPLDRLN